MIHRLLRTLVIPRQHWLRQVLNIPDVRHGVPVRRGAHAVVLVVLVVEEEVLLVHGVQHPALVSVGRTGVGGARDNLGVLFVRDVVDGEGVFIVTVAGAGSVRVCDGGNMEKVGTRCRGRCRCYRGRGRRCIGR